MLDLFNDMNSLLDNESQLAALKAWEYSVLILHVLNIPLLFDSSAITPPLVNSFLTLYHLCILLLILARKV
jgi:hypothetical protein